jgi:hypothetical protein
MRQPEQGCWIISRAAPRTVIRRHKKRDYGEVDQADGCVEVLEHQPKSKIALKEEGDSKRWESGIN